MSVPLRYIVSEVRDLLGEAKPNFWNTKQIIEYVNDGLQDICSYVQNLETIIQFPWPTERGSTLISQEANLPLNVDQIIWCGYFSGQFFQLNPLNDDSVLVANRVSGIPIGFYTRTDTLQLLTQGGGDNTGNMFVVQTEPNDLAGQEAFTALGLWPIPQQNLPFTLMCTRFHPIVKNPTDPCCIPRRFKDALIGYVMWKCKRKQQAYDEANDYYGTYEKKREEMNYYFISNKQLKGGPNYGGTMWPTLTRGSSSVIFVDQNPGILNM